MMSDDTSDTPVESVHANTESAVTPEIDMLATIIREHRFQADGFCGCQEWNIFEDGHDPHPKHVAKAILDAGYVRTPVG